MGIESMDVEKEIYQIRNDYVSSERIRKRSECEKIARDLLSPESISKLSWNTLDTVISLIDSDFWKEEEIGGRFFPFSVNQTGIESILMILKRSRSFYSRYLGMMILLR